MFLSSKTSIAFAGIVFCMIGVTAKAADDSGVKIWEESVVIPTYLAGEPDPNPMFYMGRAYQGAEGRVYPYPLYDKLTGQKADKTYTLVYLENEYVKIGVMPEIGGRIFSAVDKTNGYDFFYHQHVVKPALVGMIGDWISGGVEWNVPHHHRTSSSLPAQYRIENGEDGSKTVWVGELEWRHRMRWAVGLTLRPGKSYLEASVRVVNRTPTANTMLYFANVAVHTNENYQIIFPPRTEYVTYHAKREFATWPITKGKFAGADFGEGTDVSWYKNHDAANSMFAWNYEDDFFAGYDHGKEAGTMSVADHHVVPGKKFWTWGNSPAGKMWDNILTDKDGPYIELMVGAYSDNQPDYSWIQPFETKAFTQYWYPFRGIGGVKNANLDAAVNLEFVKEEPAKNGKSDSTNSTRMAKVGFYATSPHLAAFAKLTAGDKVLFEEIITIDPGKPFVKQIAVPEGVDDHDLRASLSEAGRELIAYSPVKLKGEPMPEKVVPPLAPKDVKTVEELYLIGQRIDQFHNPALEPDPYWLEGLRRDPGDARTNTALGIYYLKRARFADAEKCLRTAVERLSKSYTSPKDGEPIYYLGLTLRYLGKPDAAFDSFYKATWSEAWASAAYYEMAEIKCEKSDFTAAIEYIDRSLAANSMNPRAVNLKATALRHLGKNDEARKTVDAALKIDPLDIRALVERYLAKKSAGAEATLKNTMRDFPAEGLEIASDFSREGIWQDGIDTLQLVVDSAADKAKISPLTYYYLGYFTERLGDKSKAAGYYQTASNLPMDYVFPFQVEVIDALRSAMAANPKDAHASYYLGNLYFDLQPDEAIQLWEKSLAIDDTNAVAHRNLGLAYSKEGRRHAESDRRIGKSDRRKR